MGGKNALQVRAALRTDLKDSGALWSDAELNRCIERAVADLSRMLPLEKVYEKSLQFTITGEAFTSPKTTDIDYIVAAQTFNGKVAGDTFTLTTNVIDHPRVVTILVTDADASLTNFTIIVKGTDAKGKAIEETFHFGSGLSQTGKKEFKTVKEVKLDQVAGTPGAGDVLDVGIGVFTNVWAELANKPIKYASETITSLTRNTDFFMDYANGRIKAVAGGSMTANTAYTINYTIGQLWLDLNNIPDSIRVESVIYPVGEIPHSLVSWDIWEKILTITGLGEAEGQQSMLEDKHIAVYYDAQHQSPTNFSPGSYPEFLEDTVLLAASAYALFIYALKYEHQAVTDFASARTSLTNISHTAFVTALTSAASQAAAAATALDKVNTYLAGATESTKALLAQIATDIASLRTAIVTAVDALNTYLDAVATDLTSANSARANYMGTTNYVDSGTAPDIKKYLDDGDAILNTIAIGGENERTPEMYTAFARATRDALVSAHEQDRSFYLENATRRTNAAMGYAQEAAQRLSSLRAYIEQALAYSTIASGFVAEASERSSAARVYLEEATNRLNDMSVYLAESDRYTTIATQNQALADRFRTEAIERRNEAWNIWRDRKQYIGDFTQSAALQMPTYKRII